MKASLHAKSAAAMKTRIIHSDAELEAIAQQITQSASLAVNGLAKACAQGSPMNVLGLIKFEPLGYDPLGGKRLNLIEQVNQTFTYLATIEALRFLFRQHPEYAPFRVNLGTASGHDISSLNGKIVAEVFAAVAPENNQKLKKDARKVHGSDAEYRYVFFACPGQAPGNRSSLDACPDVRIVSVGVPYGQLRIGNTVGA